MAVWQMPKGSRMLATIESPTLARPVHTAEQEELGRALLKSVTAREGATFTVDVQDAAAVTDLITGLRSWLLVVGAGTGVASATVSPTFLRETYPAMLALVRELERSGATWRPSGPRTVQVGEAKHVFVSRDRPVAGRTPNPDGITEVVAAHDIDRDWFYERVSPRCQARGLTRVFYGQPGVSGSIYEEVRTESLGVAERGGPRRHFDLLSPRGAAVGAAA